MKKTFAYCVTIRNAWTARESYRKARSHGHFSIYWSDYGSYLAYRRVLRLLRHERLAFEPLCSDRE
ncbi:hypothetical protein [Desulfuromonas acetoxidans]|uniref:hypothetical protein n=1 Tax=Desulfuromonas acetoxidans TaxID=891 RepID=UPI0012DF88F7|nr:hypothetical protein [Desulfuromonas acetoxidans]MBF0644928.1 hypothetical protein [Desulfuromonas acetoxidans]NVD25445.1 hypothetical protein [Desulfuromonas acetoxidans]NVE17454.1 hypothetical protein [Desulfuromonas acetoxidans]